MYNFDFYITLKTDDGSLLNMFQIRKKLKEMQVVVCGFIPGSNELEK